MHRSRRMSKSSLSLTAAAAVLTATAIAHADPAAPARLASPDRIADASPGPTATEPSSVFDGERSEAGATVLSMVGTAAAVGGLVVSLKADNVPGFVASNAAALLLPSAGHWYAGRALTTGMGIRLAGMAVFYGGVAYFAHNFAFESANGGESLGLAIAVTGLAGVGLGALWDIGTAAGEVERYNARHHTSLQLAPTALRAPTGATVPGLALAGTF